MRLRPTLPVLIAGGWFVFVFASIVWVWGLNPDGLASPDEALNRFAAAVLSEQGRPFLHLAFPDPEDLAHPRHWVSVGDHAVPSYAPVAIYGYALLLRLRTVGFILIAALPASAAAAFAAGITRLLPAGRKWLALPAPMLAFPALYWLMRPWMNVSVLLICVCWAFFCWASWSKSGSPRQLALAVFAAGAAAAVRPDYAAYLMSFTLLLGLAESPAEWKRVLGLVLAAGATAVVVNLFLNWLVTGHPLLAAYQIVAARDEGPAHAGGVLGLLRQLLIPMGVPERGMALGFLSRYWLQMGSIAGLTLGQLALLPSLLRRPRLQRALFALALLIVLCFVLSHMDPDLNGAIEHRSLVHHSMPRYWSPVYLLAVLPPVLFLGECKSRALLLVGALCVGGLAVAGGYEIYAREVYGLVGLRDFTRRSARAVRLLERDVPQSAMLYSATHDKILWSRWRVGTIAEPEPTAQSLSRAAQAGLGVFVFEPGLKRAPYLRLDRALRRRQLTLVRGAEQGLYRLAASTEHP